LNRLDNTQRQLNQYLGGKRTIFPRFYFITQPDLLDILGSSDPEDV
jgi:dynein heavy chain